MMNPGKNYLITGGSGFLGLELIKRLVSMGYNNLFVLSRNEGKLVELKEKYPQVRIIPGDIADPAVCEMAMKEMDGVFHLAAFKHVTLAEENVRECIKSNVIGTGNLLDISLRTRPDFFIAISTDKAMNVNGVYGASKLLMERLFKDYERANPITGYRIVRYGNVLYSTGSVLCKWKDKLENGGELIITDPDATRFYWTVDQAVDLIFTCLDSATNCKPFVTPMKAVRVGDLMEAMIEKYGNGRPVIKTIGLQSGENMHEFITEDGQDSSQVERFTKEEILQMV